MRKWVLSLVSAAALASPTVLQSSSQSPEWRPQAAASAPANPSDRGLCRRPTLLPDLEPEPDLPPRDQERGAVAAPALAESEAEADDVIVTGSRIARPRAGLPPLVSLPPDESSRHEPKPGLLTAGDYDDLLNPDLYARYVTAFLENKQLGGVPVVDTRRVLTIAVEDDSGRPVPFADVTLTCADGNRLTLSTFADGTAVFFPELDRLGDRVRVSVGANGASRAISIAGTESAQRQVVSHRRAAPAVTRFDLALVIDTTGSMGDEIAYVRSELRDIIADLRRSHPRLDIRIALVVYRDIGDAYVTRTFRFTGDIDELQEVLSLQRAGGGGDYPEAMEQALHRAVALDWRPDAIRSLLLVADAPPHAENTARTWQVAEVARGRRIHITPVAASGVAAEAEYVMRAMAAATQSRYLFLTDDSGIGNPHAEPSIDCYLVTPLNALVRRVLDSQISGRRVEPRQGEVIRTLGDYDRGRCRLPRMSGRHGGLDRADADETGRLRRR